jgi:hypothetical protein
MAQARLADAGIAAHERRSAGAALSGREQLDEGLQLLAPPCEDRRDELSMKHGFDPLLEYAEPAALPSGARGRLFKICA